MDRSLGPVSRVVEFSVFDESESPYRERLDPSEAADLLVTHAIVPVCDEGLLEKVMANARRIGEGTGFIRLGVSEASTAPIAWQSPQLQSGFAPPRGPV